MAMNWLDTQTKELLQKANDEKLAPSKTAEFALVLLHKGPDRKHVVDAIIEINNCSETEATVLVNSSIPITINSDLTEGEALWGQFELICCDAVSVFLRSEIIEQNDSSYLEPLFKRVSESSEFKLASIRIIRVPTTESGDKFLKQFVAGSTARNSLPVMRIVTLKKARIMKHWATRVGAQMQMEVI